MRISRRTEAVPTDEHGMWVHLVNHLSPSTRGIGVGFVYDLPRVANAGLLKPRQVTLARTSASAI